MPDVVVPQASFPDERADPASRGADVVGAPRRGTTTVAPRVIEKIAQQAAVTVPGVEGADVGGLRGWFHARDTSVADASIDQHGGAVSIQIELAMVYPEPVAPAAERVRTVVMEQVRKDVGIGVDRVDVTVAQLFAPSAGRLAPGARP